MMNFEQTDFRAEAENMLYYGITDRDEIGAEVASAFADVAPNATAEDIENYVDGIMKAMEVLRK